MKQKAFTLIELLVVITVIGAVASVVLVSLGGTREKAHVARGLSFSQSIYRTLGVYAVAIYRLEHIGFPGTGVSPDTSGHENHLLHLPTCSISKGVINNAVSCSGLQPSCLIDSLNSNIIPFSKINEITIEAWFKLTDHIGVDGIVTIERPDRLAGWVAYQIWVDQDFHPFYCPGNCVSGQTITDFTFKLNKWYHYVMTVRGGGKAEIYINGKSVRKSSGGVPATLPDGGYIIVGSGQDCDGLASTENAIIDEVRIYSKSFNL